MAVKNEVSDAKKLKDLYKRDDGKKELTSEELLVLIKRHRQE